MTWFSFQSDRNMSNFVIINQEVYISIFQIDVVNFYLFFFTNNCNCCLLKISTTLDWSSRSSEDGLVPRNLYLHSLLVKLYNGYFFFFLLLRHLSTRHCSEQSTDKLQATGHILQRLPWKCLVELWLKRWLKLDWPNLRVSKMSFSFNLWLKLKLAQTKFKRLVKMNILRNPSC